MDFVKIAREVLKIEADELLRSAAVLGSEIETAVDVVMSTKGKLIVTGVGKSGLIGAKIAATLASTGTSSFFLHPTEAMHGDLGMIGKDDTVLAISYSGESEELTKMLPHIKRFNIPLIGMAREKSSTLGKYCDVFLSINIEKEACPLDTAPTSSTTLTLAIGDALAVCLMKKRDFKKTDFASFHPGGSLGKQLFVKVSDLMRRDSLPIVSEGILLKDAIVTMSEGRIGSILIANSNNELVGVLSDGDLRRALLRRDFSMNNRALRYACTTPKTLNNETLLASDALKIIEEHKIQLLVVVNKENQISGVLHIHDLVEAGIK